MAHEDDPPARSSRWRYAFFALPVSVFLGTGLILTARQLEVRAANEGLLEPLPPVTSEASTGETKRGSCEGVDLEETWRSLLTYTPGDDANNREVRFSRRGERGRLVVVDEGLPDDSVASQRTTYDLLWKEGKGWTLTSCEREALRCWRGAPSGGLCP